MALLNGTSIPKESFLSPGDDLDLRAIRPAFMVHRLHIVGRKNSGKTTLIVELVREFVARGIKVGTIKHTHHHHEFDAPGKDSFLHRQAGALVVGLVGPRMVAAFREHSESDQTAAIASLEPLFAECDLVLVEGQQQAEALKVEVWREATGQRPLAMELAGISALITDDLATDVPCPLWKRSDVGALADRILKFNARSGQQ